MRSFCSKRSSFKQDCEEHVAIIINNETPEETERRHELEKLRADNKRLMVEVEKLQRVFEDMAKSLGSTMDVIAWMRTRMFRAANTPIEKVKCACQFEQGDSPCPIHGDQECAECAEYYVEAHGHKCTKDVKG